MKTFNVPEFYRSPIITKVKQYRRINDPRKKDNNPTLLDFGPVRYFVARHFGFCYGVENAIEIAFRALDENPDKRIFLLSEMIHNPEVNSDLVSRGIKFLQNTMGEQLIPFDTLNSNDIVVIPAFGAPVQLLEQLQKKGIKTEAYNTTCPFVERVWKKSEQIGQAKHTIIIHGKYRHEETRATFSRSAIDSEAVVVVRNIEEARQLGEFILGKKNQHEFNSTFAEKSTMGFDINKHFEKLGVINQTTMLATETQQIADYFRELMIIKYGAESLKEHFADTRDTLCYATNENQDAALGLLETNAHLAFVVGGYNSSNTSHLVELCEKKFPTYFISSANEIVSRDEVCHFNYTNKKKLLTQHWLPEKEPVTIIITGGASCPDSMLEGVIKKINGFFTQVKPLEIVLKEMTTFKQQ